MASDTCTGRVPVHILLGVAYYILCNEDLEKLKDGVRLASEILFAAGAEKVYLPLKRPTETRNPGDVDRILAGLGPSAVKLSAYQPMSTARIGEDPDTGAVDEAGRVYGVEGLYVADASILPGSTRVNPQLTINALALQVAESIARDLGGPM